MQRGTNKIEQQGFTLIEVLVTVIIMAIGLLGVAGLQLAGIRSNHSAFLRTQATIAAYDLIDRMRADPQAFDNKHYSSTSASGESVFDAWVKELGLIGLKAPANEDPLGEVNCSSTGNQCHAGNCQIIVRWDDSRGEDIDLAQTGRSVNTNAFSVCTRLAQ